MEVFTSLTAMKFTQRHRRPAHGVPRKHSSSLYFTNSCYRRLPIFLLRKYLFPMAPAVSSSSNYADALDDVMVLDLNGEEVPISDLWKNRKTLIAFARHFGCVLCRKRADYLAAKKETLDECGVALVLIGPGNANQASTFVEQTKFEGEVYADPSHHSYKALNFISGISTTFTPKAGLKIIESYMQGYRQDWDLSLEKDTVARGGWQQGGIIVAGPGKLNISYIHRDKEAGDDPDIEDVLKACCS